VIGKQGCNKQPARSLVKAATQRCNKQLARSLVKTVTKGGAARSKGKENVAELTLGGNL